MGTVVLPFPGGRVDISHEALKLFSSCLPKMCHSKRILPQQPLCTEMAKLHLFRLPKNSFEKTRKMSFPNWKEVERALKNEKFK